MSFRPIQPSVLPQVNFLCPVGHERWDWRNPDTKGIGGSETCVVEMSWRLAHRGYPVTVYGRLGRNCPREWRGVEWRPLKETDREQEALWIVHRSPAPIGGKRPLAGRVWWMLQDVDAGGWQPEWAARVEAVLALCPSHMRFLARQHPEVAEKIRLSANGVRMDLFRELDGAGMVREPHRAIWASSPDRGLVQALLPLWGQVREAVPDAELHVYYGLENINRARAASPEHERSYGKLLAEWDELTAQPGIILHGRVNQRELYEAWLQAGVWPYWSDFTETSCIASMEAQCGGAIPVTRPLWGVAHNVRHGFVVNGSCYSDPLTQAQLVSYTAQAMLDAPLVEGMRAEMMAEARQRCSWELVADLWEQWIHDWPGYCAAQYAFQQRQVRGLTLNVGCNDDGPRLRERGAVNVDLATEDASTGRRMPVDVIADGRGLPFAAASFETVLLGDILEHCGEADAQRLFAEARRVGRRVVVTWPEDYRGERVQRGLVGSPEYRPGIASYHETPWTKARMVAALGEPSHYETWEAHYGAACGHGAVYEPC